MPTVLVSIVSYQTIPNILLIKELPTADRYLFITTREMEDAGITNNIINVCNVPLHKTTILPVLADSFNNIEDRLSDLNLKGNNEYLLNITGGMKPTAIAVYNFFVTRFNAKVYYFTVGTNTYKQLVPRNDETPIEVKTNLSLNEYFKAFGIRIVNPDTINAPLMPLDFTNNIYQHRLLDTPEIRNLIRYKTAYEKERGHNSLPNLHLNDLPQELPGLNTFLTYSLKFPTQQPNVLNSREIFYLIGGWVEEYIYYLVKEKYQLLNTHIGLNVYIERKEVKNELDIVYVRNNTLYVIECKLRLYQNYTTEESLYKLSSLRNPQNFGLETKGYLVSGYRFRDGFNQIPPKITRRADAVNIKILDSENLHEL